MFSDKFASHPSLNSFFPTVCSRSGLIFPTPSSLICVVQIGVRLHPVDQQEAAPLKRHDCPFLRSHKLPVTPQLCALGGQGM